MPALQNCILILILIFTIQYSSVSQISTDSLRNHVYFLASDSMEGRHAGGRTMFKAQDYISAHFKDAGLKPLGEDYYQEFPVYPGFGKNIIGVIEGSDSALKNEYIVLGAHYDHIGWRVNNDTLTIFNGADDNASGTAVIMEIARILSREKTLIKRSVIIIAFDGEEQGLVGSSYFLKHLPVSKDKIRAMMSIDMVGSYQLSKRVTFDGCGSFEGGKEFIESVDKVKALNVDFSLYSILWKERTDTKPFYDSKIPCLYVSTGLVSAYHKPGDDAEFIDYDGMTKISEQIINVTIALAQKENIDFKPTKGILSASQSSFRMGLNFGNNFNYQAYSEGPFNTKSLLGYGAGLNIQFHLFAAFDFQTEFDYAYLGIRSIDGTIRLHNLTVPMSIMLISKPDLARVFIKLGGFFSYSLSGNLNSDRIDWLKTGYSRNDYGFVYGIGFESLNSAFDFSGYYGLKGFYSNEPIDFMNIGIARNVTIKFTMKYNFIY